MTFDESPATSGSPARTTVRAVESQPGVLLAYRIGTS